MQSNTNKTVAWKKTVLIGGLALAAMAVAVMRLETKNSAFAQEAPATFQSPAEASAALAKAAGNGDRVGMVKMFGPQTTALLFTGEKGNDKAAMDDFVSRYNKMNRWVEMTDRTWVLYIGADNFAFPVPLAKDASGRWYFDAVAGAQEIRARDIGRNELLAIDASFAFANAEEEYSARRSDSPEFAQRIISTAGRQDGLYWPAADKAVPSPLGDLDKLPKDSLGSNLAQETLVLDGYTYRILTAQGDAASGGARNYIVDGKATEGFAILATPVKYRETGITTFMTGPDGIVYERDLGPGTAKIGASIREFNPTEEWSPLE